MDYLLNDFLDINSKLAFSKTNKEINTYYKNHIRFNIPRETQFYFTFIVLSVSSKKSAIFVS